MANMHTTKITMILVAAEQVTDIRRVLASLRMQNNTDEIELLLVGPNASTFQALPDEETGCFGRVEMLSWGQPITDVDLSAAVGIRAAQSPVVAKIEDHFYPDPDWSQIIIEAHEKYPEVAGVGCEVALANAPGALPWANHLFALAKYTAPLESGFVPRVSRHQVAYKKAWTDTIDAELESFLPRGGGMIEKAAADGGLYMAADARLHHLSPAIWRESLPVRLASGRLNGSSPKNTGGFVGKLIATVKTPLIAWWRIRPQLQKYPPLKWRALSVALATIPLTASECIGYVIGIWAGRGTAYERVCQHEYQRERYIRASDIRHLDRHWPVENLETVNESRHTLTASPST